MVVIEYDHQIKLQNIIFIPIVYLYLLKCKSKSQMVMKPQKKIAGIIVLVQFVQ